MTDKPDVAELVERLKALHVWPQFVADEHADILTPRQIRNLYEVGNVAHEAATTLTTLSHRVEELEAALREIAHLSNGEPFYGIRAIDIARAALGGSPDEA